ncbi:MAG: phosphotransferase family protein [Rhizobiaceae bacterium]|nr:phosphotransferase family protein [Rhizobiaceae bacterium]MCV0404889.1 phosphotransferase family protein [Rhizobiaceae bacterium]
MPIFEGEDDTSDLGPLIQQWLRKRPGYGEAVVEEISSATSGTGWSNETYRLTLRRAPGAEVEKLILRLPPSGEALLRDYDIGLQFATVQALQGIAGYPVVAGRWLEPDPGLLGRPFYLMDYVEGWTPSDRPIYLRSGWVHEAADEQRRRMWLASVETIARLPSVDWRARGLDVYQWPDRNRSCIEQNIEHWAGLYDWGSTFLPPADVRIVDELRRWLELNAPREEEVTFNWGDARFANFIYRDFEPVALLDWELATVGEPELDITFFLFAHRHLQLLAHEGDRHAPDLGGFLSEEETIVHYERVSGVKVRNPNFYWLFNAYRIYGVRQRIAGLSVRWKTLDLDAAMKLRAVPTLEEEVAARMT